MNPKNYYTKKMLLFLFVITATALCSYSQNTQKRVYQKPDYANGWIYIGVFDSITGNSTGQVFLTDTAGTPIKNIRDVKNGGTYILKTANNGLWIEPPGFEGGAYSQSKYLEVKTLLGPNRIIQTTSEVYVSKIKHWKNYHWIKIRVLGG